MWAQRDPDAAEALTALKLIPARIPAASVLTDAVQKAIAAGWRQGNLADALDAARILTERRLDIPEAWRELSQEDRRLRGLCAALAEPGGPPRDILKRLRGVDGAVATARAREIALSLFRLDAPDVVAAALSEFPDPVGDELLRLAAQDYAQQPAPAVRWEFRLLTAKRLPPPLRRQLEDDLRRQLARGDSQLARFGVGSARQRRQGHAGGLGRVARGRHGGAAGTAAEVTGHRGPDPHVISPEPGTDRGGLPRRRRFLACRGLCPWAGIAHQGR